MKQGVGKGKLMTLPLDASLSRVIMEKREFKDEDIDSFKTIFACVYVAVV